MVQSSAGQTLASYTYDAFGRRVASQIGTTQRHYYYAGQSVTEEYTVNGGVEALARYHVDGGQYVDEHVATYDVQHGTAVPTYYLLNSNFSVLATANADGTRIRALDDDMEADGLNS
jgi:hypothetical protein